MTSQIEVLPVINEIQNIINSEDDLNINLQTIVKGSKKLINFDYLGIVIKNEEDAKFSPLLIVPESAMNLNNVEKGAIGWIIDHGLTLLINDISKEKRLRYNYLTLSQDENSFIGAPLLINEKKINWIIFALSKKIAAFLEDDIMVLENLGGMIISSFNKSESRKAIIATMKNIDTELHTELRDTRKVMDKIVQYAIELTHADHGCLVRYNYWKNQLECRYAAYCKKFDENYERGCIFNIDANNNLLSEVFSEEKGKKVNNIKNEGYISIIDKKDGKKIQSQIAIPLIGKSRKPFGVLLLESINISYFSVEHLDILGALSELGVTAFNDSKLIRKLERLSEASNVLLKEDKSRTLEEKFDFIVKKTIELLDAELCTLFLVHDNRLHLMTSFAIERDTGEGTQKIKKRQKEDRILEIKDGKKTGQTGAIAYKKEVYNEYGESLRNHPSAKNPDDTGWLPSKFNYSELAYPMLDENGKLLGLFLVHNKRDETGSPLTNRGFSREFDEPLMRILTTKLIISIKNAQLINQLSNSLNQLKNYELIVENTPDPVAITTRHGVITYLNEGAINLFGNLIGKKVYDYYYSDEMMTGLDRAKEIMCKLYKSEDGRIKNVETIFKSKDGHPIPVSLSASLLRDDKGEIIGTVGISKDLREIKTLLEIGNSLLSTHDTNEILKKICDECIKLPKSNRAYIKLYDEKSDSLYFRELSSSNSEDKLPKEPSPKNRGMTGFVFMMQEQYLSGDVTKEPPGRFHRIFSDVKSKLVVPISSIDKATRNIKRFGVISVDSKEKHAFTVNDIHFLSTLANQAANALENANLIAYKDRIINELSALEKVRKTITETSNFEEILESSLDSVTDILGFDYATISEVKKDSGTIGTVRSRNVPDGWVEDSWHSLDSNDIQAWVVRNKKEVKLTGWDDRIDKMMYDKYHQEELVRIYIPIIARGEVLGTLETGNYKIHKSDIEPEEIEILRKVVNLAGIGIEQVNLVERLKSDLELRNELEKQLHALNQASIDIQYANTEEEAINHIFMSLESIGYNKGMVSLVNKESEMIEGKYALGDNWKTILGLTKRPMNGNDILAAAIRKKKPLLVKDCNEDIRCDKIAIQAGNIKSQYVIPLVVNDVGIGTLQIDLTDKPELVYGDEQELKRRMRVLETFANQSAIAIRNIRDIGTIDFLETSLAETAHEFRSPLHNIMTELGGLKDYLEFKYQKQEREIDKIVMSITEEAYRAKRQMENTLLLSDKSKKLMGYHFEEGLIQKITEHVASSFQVRAIKRSIKIIVKDSVFQLPKIVLDKQKIEQVITNLVDNAVKYSNFGRKIFINGYDLGKKIQVDISDRGLGIPENERENIFKGFTRSEFKDKNQYIPGTGIGLKISKEIIEGHGGSIVVKSDPVDQSKKGWYDYIVYETVFSLFLPKQPKES